MKGKSDWFLPPMIYGRPATFPDDYTTLEVMKNLIDLAYGEFVGLAGSANGGSTMPQIVWIGGQAPKGGCMISDYCWMAAEYQVGGQVTNIPIPFAGYNCTNTTKYCLAAALYRDWNNAKDVVSVFPEDCSESHAVVCEFGK